MSSDIRYGVIGTGMMGLEHIHNLAHLDGAVVTAVSDPNADSLATGMRAAELPPANAFTDHRDLIASGACDAVVVASPNHTHVEVLLDVLEAGLHVLSEKPLCTTVEDCRKVVDAADAADGIAWMGLEYRYKAPIARLIREAAAGTAGTIHQVAIREHRFPFLHKVDHWNRFRRNSGGTLVEKCCHFFDLMSLIIGAEPTRVMASGGQDVNHLDEEYPDGRPDIIDNAYVIVEFDNGVRAMLDLCMFAEGGKNEQELTVVGDVAKLEAFVPESLLRIGWRADRRVEEFAVPVEVPYEGLHEGSSYLEHVDFRDAIVAGTEPLVTMEDGLRAVAIGVAAHRSIDEGRVVAVSEVL